MTEEVKKEETASAKKKSEFIIAPMNKRITVRIEAPMKQTAGGIIIPEAAQEKEAPTRGTVMGIAKDCRDDIKVLIKPGIQVIFSKYSGVDVFPKEENGNNTPVRFQILKEEDILAVLVPKNIVYDYVHVDENDKISEDDSPDDAPEESDTPNA